MSYVFRGVLGPPNRTNQFFNATLSQNRGPIQQGGVALPKLIFGCPVTTKFETMNNPDSLPAEEL